MIPYVGGDDIGAIVADFGHHTTKMGFAGEDSPRAWFRSEVAVQRQSETEGPSIKVKDKSDMEIISSSSSSTSSGSLSNKYSTPISAIQYDYLSRPLDPDTGNDGDWDTFNPVDPLTGLLRNYDNPYCEIPPLTNPPSTSNTTATTTTIPPLWTHMFSHGMTTSLLAQTPELVTPILMVEKSYNPPAIRQKVREILFEYFNAPAVFMARDAVMSCYACGRTTGVVVDIGSSGITVSPVYDGFVESRGVIRSPMGTTTAIDEYCLKRLDISCNNSNSGKKVEVPPFYQVRSKGKKRFNVFHRLCRLDMANNFRESIALTADIGYDPEDSTNGKHLPKLPYKLPDGSNIDVECEERHNITETLFGRDDDNTDIRENACHIHKNRTAAHAAAVAAATADAAK